MSKLGIHLNKRNSKKMCKKEGAGVKLESSIKLYLELNLAFDKKDENLLYIVIIA